MFSKGKGRHKAGDRKVRSREDEKAPFQHHTNISEVEATKDVAAPLMTDKEAKNIAQYCIFTNTFITSDYDPAAPGAQFTRDDIKSVLCYYHPYLRHSYQLMAIVPYLQRWIWCAGRNKQLYSIRVPIPVTSIVSEPDHRNNGLGLQHEKHKDKFGLLFSKEPVPADPKQDIVYVCDSCKYPSDDQAFMKHLHNFRTTEGRAPTAPSPPHDHQIIAIDGSYIDEATFNKLMRFLDEQSDQVKHFEGMVRRNHQNYLMRSMGLVGNIVRSTPSDEKSSSVDGGDEDSAQTPQSSGVSALRQAVSCTGTETESRPNTSKQHAIHSANEPATAAEQPPSPQGKDPRDEIALGDQTTETDDARSTNLHDVAEQLPVTDLEKDDLEKDVALMLDPVIPEDSQAGWRSQKDRKVITGPSTAASAFGIGLKIRSDAAPPNPNAIAGPKRESSTPANQAEARAETESTEKPSGGG